MNLGLINSFKLLAVILVASFVALAFASIFTFRFVSSSQSLFKDSRAPNLSWTLDTVLTFSVGERLEFKMFYYFLGGKLGELIAPRPSNRNKEFWSFIRVRILPYYASLLFWHIFYFVSRVGNLTKHFKRFESPTMAFKSIPLVMLRKKQLLV